MMMMVLYDDGDNCGIGAVGGDDVRDADICKWCQHRRNFNPFLFTESWPSA